jgi:hypothetical protein
MADAICFIGWDSYSSGVDGRGFFAQEPLAFNSAQPRLHQISVDNRIWLVSRHPDDKQYYVVAVLRVAERRRNDPAGEIGRSFGEYGIIADRIGSYDLALRFPAEVLLDNFVAISEPPQFKEYGRALEWGYPTGVGWRPLDLFQTNYLMHLSKLDIATMSFYLGAVLK